MDDVIFSISRINVVDEHHKESGVGVHTYHRSPGETVGSDVMSLRPAPKYSKFKAPPGRHGEALSKPSMVGV